MSRVLGKLNIKSVVLATAIMFCSQSAFATVNLSQVELSQGSNGYNIVLKTDKKTTFKKVVQNNDKVIIEIKGAVASEDFSTIYNEVADINNVTVTPSGKEDLKIQIQGADVDKSNVSIDYKDAPLAVEAQNFDQNQINLSLPMETYKPVYHEIEEEEIEEETNLGSALSNLNPITIAHKLKGNSNTSQPSNNNFKWITYLGLFIIMASAGKNLFKQTNDSKIGLTQSLKEREREIAQKLNTGVKETLSLRNKIQQNATAPSINYGLRSYQNSQKNPYETASTPIRPIRKTNSLSNTNATLAQPTSTFRTKPQVTKTLDKPQTYTSQAIKPRTVTRNNSVNVDSMKFLESMTKIYEKNGRTDLAMGLKNNINKVNI